MHICDHHIKVYYNIEKRKLVKIEIEIYKGGQTFIGGGGGGRNLQGEQKWTSTQVGKGMGYGHIRRSHIRRSLCMPATTLDFNYIHYPDGARARFTQTFYIGSKIQNNE